MACTPKPNRRQNKVLTALMRRHQRRNPKSVVIFLDENWTMFNGYRNALVKRMGVKAEAVLTSSRIAQHWLRSSSG